MTFPGLSCRLCGARENAIEAWLSLVERCVRDAEVASSNLVIPTRKKHAKACFFQLNPSWRTGEIHLRWMKSLRDEIRLRRVKRTDLISSSAKCSISSEGFARRFHRGAPQGPRNELAEFWGKGQCLDFTYHTIFRLNMGCSATVKLCLSQVRFRYPHHIEYL